MLTNYNTIQQYQNWLRMALIQGSQIRAVCLFWHSIQFVDWSLPLLFHKYFWVFHINELQLRNIESALCVLILLSISVDMFGWAKLSGSQVRPFSRVNHYFLFSQLSHEGRTIWPFWSSQQIPDMLRSHFPLCWCPGDAVWAPCNVLNQVVLTWKWAV